jgi:hypothetical protein
MVNSTTLWTLATARPTTQHPIPVVDALPAGFRGSSVPTAAAAHGYLGMTADAGIVRDKDATSGGTAWGPPV